MCIFSFIFHRLFSSFTFFVFELFFQLFDNWFSCFNTIRIFLYQYPWITHNPLLTFLIFLFSRSAKPIGLNVEAKKSGHLPILSLRIRLNPLQRNKAPSRKGCPGYDNKLHLMGRLQFSRWEAWISHSLLLLPGSLWPMNVSKRSV